MKTRCHSPSLRWPVAALVLALSTACGGGSEPTTETAASSTSTGSTGGEESGRARAYAQWNDELARLRSDATFSSAYDARAAELEQREPTDAHCEELAVLAARASEPRCDPSQPGCPQPSDRAATPAEVSARPTFDHECPAPAWAPDPASGEPSIESDAASRFEGCSAAWTSWLFARCSS